MRTTLGEVRRAIRRALVVESASSVLDLVERDMEQQSYALDRVFEKLGDDRNIEANWQRFKALEDAASDDVVRSFDRAFGTQYSQVDRDELRALEAGTSAEGLSATFHALWHESLRPNVWHHFFTVGRTSSLEDELNEDLVTWLSRDHYDPDAIRTRPDSTAGFNSQSITAKRLAEALLDTHGDDLQAAIASVKEDITTMREPQRAAVIDHLLSYAVRLLRQNPQLDEQALVVRLSVVLWNRFDRWGQDIIDVEVASRLRRWLRATKIIIKRWKQRMTTAFTKTP